MKIKEREIRKNNNNQTSHNVSDIDIVKQSQFFHVFKSELGFKIPKDWDTFFGSICDRMNGSSLKKHKSRLSPHSNRNKNWYNKIQNSLGDCHRQVGQCLYHLDNLNRYELLAIEVIKNHYPLSGMKENPHMAISAEKIDYEFHALVNAIKTYLSYLATVTFAFFKIEQHSFKKFKNNLTGLQPIKLSNNVNTILNKHWLVLSKYYNINEKKPVRDTIAHKKFVGAGWINIYGLNNNIVAAMAMPDEILRNETVAPKFEPDKVLEKGLGTAKIMKEQLSFLRTLSFEILETMELYKSNK